MCSYPWGMESASSLLLCVRENRRQRRCKYYLNVVVTQRSAAVMSRRRRALPARSSSAAGSRRPPARMPTPLPAPTASSDPDDLPQGLTLNYWFNAEGSSQPYVARLRLVGHRRGVQRPTARDGFVHVEAVEVPPNSGPISVSPRIFDINAGEWDVAAEMIRPSGSTARPRSSRPLAPSTQAVHPARWSWLRWKLMVRPPAPRKTRLAPLTGFDERHARGHPG